MANNCTHRAKCVCAWCRVAVLALALPATAAPVYYIVPLGLADLEHTRNEGYRHSYAHQLNEAGQVVGHSLRYNGGSSGLGASAWQYNGANTFEIGLTDNEHTSNNGVKNSSAQQLNEAGQTRNRFLDKFS